MDKYVVLSEEEYNKLKNEANHTTCPYGYKFGKECDFHSECDYCPYWESCINYDR